MHFPLFAALLSMSALLCARATGPSGPSGTSTAYTCPAADQAGFPLGSSDVAADPIFCSYPATPGENPNDFFCKYSRTTGALAQDNDAGFCPGSASAAALTPRDEERRHIAHAPLPTRPQNSPRGVRDSSNRKVSYLKKRRISVEHAL